MTWKWVAVGALAVMAVLGTACSSDKDAGSTNPRSSGGTTTTAQVGTFGSTPGTTGPSSPDLAPGVKSDGSGTGGPTATSSAIP